VCNGARKELEGRLPMTVAAASILLVVNNVDHAAYDAALPTLAQLADLTNLTTGTIASATNDVEPKKLSFFPQSHTFPS
jgi:hypothetical protein